MGSLGQLPHGGMVGTAGRVFAIRAFIMDAFDFCKEVLD
jgi:hypothetical protein